MKLVLLGLRCVLLCCFISSGLVFADGHNPISYFFSNGAHLSIHNGLLDFTPAQDDADATPFTESLPEKALVMVPQGASQNGKNPNSTSLSTIKNGPLALHTPPAKAVPLVWTDDNGANKIAFITQNGLFIHFSESLAEAIKHTKNSSTFLRPINPASLSYHIVDTSDSSFVILATVGKAGSNIPTSLSFPWVINSDGTSRVLDFEIPTDFTFTYDDSLRSAYFEKAKRNKLFEIAIDSASYHHQNKRDVPNWDNYRKLRPKLCVVLNQIIEWKSDTQGSVVSIENGAVVSQLTKVASGPESKPRTLTPIPEVNAETGRKVPADKFLAEFAHKYKASELVDYGYIAEEFRPLAISLFGDPAGSMAVTGEPGGGKTTFVEAFMRSVLNGEFREKGVNPSDVEFFRFSATSLTGGTTLRGAEEARVDAILKYAEWAKANGKHVIFFVDELQTLTSSGANNHDGNDVFQSFLTHLADGTLKIIGSTTDNGYLTIASRPDLERRIPQYPFKTITEDEVPFRLRNWITAHKKPALSDKFLSYVSQVANEFDSSGEPISRAARLLSRLYTEASFDGLSMDVVEKNPQYILDLAARFYGYNIQNFTLENLDTKLSEIDEKFKNIVGFDEIKDKIKRFHVRTVTRSRLSSKAEGRYLLISPKGLGKSTTVATVADALGRPYVRIPLSAYSDKEMLYADIARAAKKNPYSVILFDELGDAPREIIIALNSALDAQKISADLNYGNTNGRHIKTVIDLGRTLVFAATNSGATVIEDAYKKAFRPIGFSQPEIERNGGKVSIDPEELRKRAIAEGLIESLYDRFEALPVLYYAEEEFKQILSIHYDETFRKLNKRNHLDVSLDPAAKEAFVSILMKKHYSPTGSPRAAIKEIEETIENYYAYLATKEKSPKAAELMSHSCKTLLGG